MLTPKIALSPLTNWPVTESSKYICKPVFTSLCKSAAHLIQSMWPMFLQSPHDWWRCTGTIRRHLQQRNWLPIKICPQSASHWPEPSHTCRRLCPSYYFVKIMDNKRACVGSKNFKFSLIPKILGIGFAARRGLVRFEFAGRRIFFFPPQILKWGHSDGLIQSAKLIPKQEKTKKYNVLVQAKFSSRTTELLTHIGLE